MDALGFGIIDVDLERRKADLDSAAVELFGGNLEWLEGDGVPVSRLLAQLGPEGALIVRKGLHAITPESPSFITEFSTPHGAGARRWVLLRAVAYFDSRGRMLRILGVLIDLTALDTDTQTYLTALPGQGLCNLVRLADLLLAARHLIDQLGLTRERSLVDPLLICVGHQLRDQMRSEAEATLN